MCGGQGCAQSQETRQYNKRLQPVLMEVGNSSNPAADDCLAYNYYGSAGTPTGCALPAQGTGDNGNIWGAFRQDSVNPGYSHSFTFGYDALNRLTTAVATGSPAYNMTYNYDQYGNVTCVQPSGGLACTQRSYNSGNNRLTQIGGATPININYDAAGNQLNDQFSTYEYDAEGRVKHSYSTGQWQYPMYNALGQRVQEYQGTDPMTLTYPVDISGRRTGAFAQWPSQNWTGWNVYWARVAGQHISMGGADSWLAHADAIDSTTMVTDETGAWVWDQVFGPWGEVWQQTGTRPWFVFAGLRWPVNDPLYPSASREYSEGVARWMTPDEFGGRLANPQTLNKYSYVEDNPTTLTDPLGLYVCADDPLCKSKQDIAFEEARQQDLLSKDANVARGAKAYGDPTKDNGVTVTFGDPGKGWEGNTTHDIRVDPNDPNKFQAVEAVTIRAGLSGSALDAAVGHEGSHVADAQDFVNTITMGGSFNAPKNLSTYQTELKAYMVTQSILSSENAKFGYGDCGLSGACILGAGIIPAQAVQTINELLANPANRYGTAPHYGVTSANPGPVLYPALTVPH